LKGRQQLAERSAQPAGEHAPTGLQAEIAQMKADIEAEPGRGRTRRAPGPPERLALTASATFPQADPGPAVEGLLTEIEAMAVFPD